MTEKIIGILEWFHVGEYERAEQVLKELAQLKVRHLRTGLSWADFHRPDGKEWYEWLIPRLAEEVELLPCITYTPGSLGIENRTNSPPRDPNDFSIFVGWVIDLLGEHFEWVELWNEPNNLSEYDWTLDPDWSTFTTMMQQAAEEAHKRGKKTLMGGTSPTDVKFIDFLFEEGVGQHFDAIGVHGFPRVWEHNWRGWKHIVSSVQDVLDQHESDAAIWISETGYSTWNHNFREQLAAFSEAVQAPVERIYWYSLHDLHAQKSAMVGFHTDEREYHFGMITSTGQAKPLFRLWGRNGIETLKSTSQTRRSSKNGHGPHALITGGAGFIGTNLAQNLLDDGYTVTIYDNLSRKHVTKNLQWLQERYRTNLHVHIADIRNPYELRQAMEPADEVFHLAGQVAVTTSLEHPLDDFDVNLRGTLNLLEIMRTMDQPPNLIFTSTNKVYGNLQNIKLQQGDTQYYPIDAALKQHGVSEDFSLDMHSPYGCSKGSADQYVLDYARVYDLSTVVFRMSCIYGPHQYGNEDQGWVAHFLISAVQNQPITIFGNGKQVRDILYVGDLVQAFRMAQENIHRIKGEAFNIGGGSENAVSLLEILDAIEQVHGVKPKITFDEWRVGDQRYYVSDTRKFQLYTGWKPQTSPMQGLKKMYRNMQSQIDLPLLNVKEGGLD